MNSPENRTEDRRPYTPDQLAERWGCPGETVRQMCRTGRLRSFVVGKMYRITAAEVDRYEAGEDRASGGDVGAAGLNEPPVIVITRSKPRARRN